MGADDDSLIRQNRAWRIADFNAFCPQQIENLRIVNEGAKGQKPSPKPRNRLERHVHGAPDAHAETRRLGQPHPHGPSLSLGISIQQKRKPMQSTAVARAIDSTGRPVVWIRSWERDVTM